MITWAKRLLKWLIPPTPDVPEYKYTKALSGYIDAVNRHGADSNEALQARGVFPDKEFQDLCDSILRLKQAMQPT